MPVDPARPKEADCLLSVIAAHIFLWRGTSDGFAEGVSFDSSVIRKGRQELKPQYQETGAFYVLRTEGFLAAGNRFFGRVALFEMPPEKSVDIDGSLDLELAEFLVTRNTRHSE